MLKYEHKMNLSKARKELEKLDSDLMKNNIDYVIVGGCLLGCFRHKDFIPWDDDIDVLIKESDMYSFEKIIGDSVELFESKTITSGKTNIFDHFGRIIRNSIQIGVFDVKDWLPTRRAKFNNFSVNVPQNPISVLNFNFGPNWRTTVRKTSDNTSIWATNNVVESNFTDNIPPVEDILL